MKLAKEKIVDLEQAVDIVNGWKNTGNEIVFTNGCFDILHLGHVDYLEKARSLGDKMVLALNTDESVSKLKGPERPVNNLEARARILASLQFIDLIVPFSEDTPYGTIKKLKPSILVKGKDYDISNIVGADVVIGNGGRVETIDLVDGYSTTGIIDRLKK